jgi:hypothetical protein
MRILGRGLQMLRRRQGSVSFLKKRNKKLLLDETVLVSRPMAHISKILLVLFFQKEPLAFL